MISGLQFLAMRRIGNAYQRLRSLFWVFSEQVNDSMFGYHPMSMSPCAKGPTFPELGFTFMFHSCVLTPITVMAGLASGGGFLVVIGAILSISIVVITSLAALPTRITIPVFFLSVIVDLVLIGYSLIQAIHY